MKFGIPYLILLTLSLHVDLSAADGDSILHFSFDEPSPALYTIEAVSNTSFPITNHFNNPERIDAVNNSALRLDGFSTFVAKSFAIGEISRQMTIETWYATEAFTASTDGNRNPIENAAIISQISDNSGFALKIDPYGRVVFDFHADGNKYEVRTPGFIPKYVWNHIVATVDLTGRYAAVFVNGECRKTIGLDPHSELTLADVTLYLGKHNTAAYFAGFNLTTLNGALDEIKIFDTAFPANKIRARYESLAPPVPDGFLFEDFEGSDYRDWEVIGSAFGSAPATGTLPNQQAVSGFLGNQLVNSYVNGDISQGKMTSPEFLIQYDLIKFLIGGGRHPDRCAIRLIINQEIIQTSTGRNSETLIREEWDVSQYWGQTAHIEIVDSVTGGWGHILIDHIACTNIPEYITADLYIDPHIRHGNDYLRPGYHPMPNTSWTNEPYGLTYYKGRYHLFFQKNPNGPYLHFMHWGHLSSPDLTDWKEEPVVFGPSPGFDDFGVWSGTTIKDADNKPVIIYTGVDVARAGIGIATPEDDGLISWKKYPGNPVIASAPSGLLDFRDPFVWKDNDYFYMIVGSGKSNNAGGTLPTYRSQDLVNWTQIRTLHSNSTPQTTGFFWEMPFFFPLNKKSYVLGINPLFEGRRAQFMYWTGTWENEEFTPYFANPRSLDFSSRNLLAPAVGADSAGRVTYIGIIPEDRAVEDQIAAGWRHTFSLPRVVRMLNDSTLGQIPHPNLCRLRGDGVRISDREIMPGTNFNLNEFRGTQIELELKIMADQASRFSVQVYKHADGTEFTAVTFNLDGNTISLDRRYSTHSVATKDLQTVRYVFDHQDTIRARIFLDHSTIEVFIDNLAAFSSRVYPSRIESDNVDLVVASGKVHIVSMNGWQLKSFGDAMDDTVCDPDQLPGEFRTNVRRPGYDPGEIAIYPNPAGDFFLIELPVSGTQYFSSLALFSSDGKCLQQYPSVKNRMSICVKNLENGVYYLQLRGEQYYHTSKIIISHL